MNSNNNLVLFVLSCDAYKDLWPDFFNLRERYWPDCPYNWYLITESEDFSFNNLSVIKCGKDKNWAGRLRYALNIVESEYYGLFLEDFFITDKINNYIIKDLLDIMRNNNITFINTSDVFHNMIGMKNKSYFTEHLIIIPNHRKYGVSAQAAIWQKKYLLEKLGENDYSAWQFEVDRVHEAQSEDGLGGFNLCDDRMPFHVSIIPVVIQGKVYPPSRKYFKKKGYIFETNRPDMTMNQVFIYRLKVKCSRLKFGRSFLKWVATKFFKIKLFT